MDFFFKFSKFPLVDENNLHTIKRVTIKWLICIRKEENMVRKSRNMFSFSFHQIDKYRNLTTTEIMNSLSKLRLSNDKSC